MGSLSFKGEPSGGCSNLCSTCLNGCAQPEETGFGGRFWPPPAESCCQRPLSHCEGTSLDEAESSCWLKKEAHRPDQVQPGCVFARGHPTRVVSYVPFGNLSAPEEMPTKTTNPGAGSEPPFQGWEKTIGHQDNRLQCLF